MKYCFIGSFQQEKVLSGSTEAVTAVQKSVTMANSALMPLQDNPQSAELTEWAFEPACLILMNKEQNPPSQTPFQDCMRCNGICSVLCFASSVRQLLDGQKVSIFQGRYEQLKDFATGGCKFAKYLLSYIDGHFGNPQPDELINLAFRRMDHMGPSNFGLVSLVQVTAREDRNLGYLSVASAVGRATTQNSWTRY